MDPARKRGQVRRDRHRAAWTAIVEGQAAKTNKYHVAPKEERGHYASKHEADEAAKLWALFRAGKIKDLQEQVRVTLVPKNGKLRAIVWVADFVWRDMDGFTHYADAKSGYTAKLPVYRLKKRLAQYMLGITIEEI